VVPIVVLALAGLLLVAVVARLWPVSVVAGALLSVCAALALASMLSHTVAAGGDDLVVMSANLLYGRADAQSLVAAARAHQVDVLVLVEITPAAVERLSIAGLDSLLPESAGSSMPGAAGIVVRSRIPLTLLEAGPGHGPQGGLSEPAVALHRRAGDLVLRAVHSLPPALSGASRWRSGLADLQSWRERQTADLPLVMAGDFNSSQSHPGFRQVAATMTDAHRAAGDGWVRTWPQGRRLIPPFVQLDHVLVRGLGVVDAGVVVLPGTDHSAVWARLSVHNP
jgi:endonuclease/exonuclease/phosphatase (EEP) superfamily protein YafD